MQEGTHHVLVFHLRVPCVQRRENVASGLCRLLFARRRLRRLAWAPLAGGMLLQLDQGVQVV